MMNPIERLRTSRPLQLAGYVLFTLATFLLSLYVTAPADALIQRLEQEVQRQTLGAWSLGTAEGGVYGLSGLRLEQVVFTRHPVELGEEPLYLPIDRLQARLRLLPLFLGHLSVDVGVQLGDGGLTARISPLANAGIDLGLRVDDLDLAVPPLLGALTGLPAGGKLTAQADLHLPADPRQASGQVKFSARHLSVGPGTTQGFTLPLVELGDIETGLELKDGRAQLQNFKQSGGSLNLQLTAKSQLQQPLGSSSLDACAMFRVDPKYLNANPKVRALMQLAEMQLRRDPANFLHVPLQGVLQSPVFRPGLCR